MGIGEGRNGFAHRKATQSTKRPGKGRGGNNGSLKVGRFYRNPEQVDQAVHLADRIMGERDWREQE
jgi:hypothetical protein